MAVHTSTGIGDAVNAIVDGNKPDLLPLALAIAGAVIAEASMLRRAVFTLGGPVTSSGPLSSSNYYGIGVTEPREFGINLRLAFGSR